MVIPLEASIPGSLAPKAWPSLAISASPGDVLSLRRSAFLAERLVTSPPVSRGCSVTEILAILGSAVGLWLPLGALIGWWQGATQLGLAGGVTAIVLTMAVVPSILQRMKRDRPHGYYQHWFAVKLHDLGLLCTPYIRMSGRWDLGRRLP